MSGAMSGAITQYIDVAQLVLYLFWAFFAALIYYLHQEGKREGYPLERDVAPDVKIVGFPGIPSPKTFVLRDGTTRTAPHNNTGHVPGLKAASLDGYSGSPLDPTGNPMLDGVGPGAYAIRPDIPDMTVDNVNKIVPMRIAPNFHLEENDPNPIGMDVIAGDGKVAGKVTEVWVDRAEILIRYLEVKVAANQRNVLIPMNFARISKNVAVRSIFAEHFADVPGTKHPECVTMMEEERIMAYYGAGTLYASPERSEPLI
jgi:photosynthetic reaction center H subunit